MSKTENGEEMLRILLVDDHEMVRQGISQILEREDDIKVVGQAGTGKQGVELALELKPDVVLMDVSMPGEGGVDATAEIKEKIPETRVIGLSMHVMDELEQNMKKAGADDYISKDAPPEKLIEAIRKSGTPAQ